MGLRCSWPHAAARRGATWRSSAHDHHDQSGSNARRSSAQGAAVAFARCMRSNGVPNWPDPNRERSVRQVEARSAAARRQQLPSPGGPESLRAPAPERRQRAERRPAAAGEGAGAASSPGACASTASRASPTPTATAAYPTLPPSASIRARRSSRPRTEPVGSTGRPTCRRTPPTTPTRGHTGDERREPTHRVAERRCGKADLDAEAAVGAGLGS